MEGVPSAVAVERAVGLGTAVPTMPVAEARSEAETGHLGVVRAAAVVLANTSVRLRTATATARTSAAGLLTTVPELPEKVA